MAGVEHGVDLGGGRSSGELGVGVREHGRRQRGVLRPPGVALSTAACSVAALGNGGYGGDMAGGEELSAPVDIGASRRKSARGGRGSTQQLTADRTKGLVSSGASSLLRIERRPSAAVEDEVEPVVGGAGHPALLGSVQRTRTMSRGSWARQRGEGVVVAAVTASVATSSARAEREREQRRG